MKKLIIKSIGAYLNTLAYLNPEYCGKKGFELFCTPFSAKMKSHQLKYLNSAELFTLDVNGEDIQCYKWGTGTRTILLIHGWADTSFRWKSLITRLLEEDCTIFAFDAQGHGQSGGKHLNLIKFSDAIKKVVNHIGNVDVAIGHSFGGASLVYACANYDLPIKKTSIMGAPGEVKDFFSFYRNTFKLSVKSMACVRKAFIDNIGQEPEYFSVKKFGKSLNQETLIIHDLADKSSHYNNAQFLHDAAPNAHFITTKGLGHGLKSIQLNKLIVDFCTHLEKEYTQTLNPAF